MLDFGWTELLMIGVVAVVIIGPKDLPKAMSGLADWVRKLRGLARDFQGQVDDMVKGTELEDVKKAAQGLNRYNVKRQISNVVDPKGQMRKALDETRNAANARLKETRQIAADATAADTGKAAGALGDSATPSIGGGESGSALADDPVAVSTMGGAVEPQPPSAPPAKQSPQAGVNREDGRGHAHDEGESHQRTGKKIHVHGQGQVGQRRGKKAHHQGHDGQGIG